jgi:hypothetical protein
MGSIKNKNPLSNTSKVGQKRSLSKISKNKTPKLKVDTSTKTLKKNGNKQSSSRNKGSPSKFNTQNTTKTNTTINSSLGHTAMKKLSGPSSYDST